MGCIFFHFGWLRKKNAQKNTSESSLFFLLPSVSQCYPTKFFFQHGMTKNFPPILFCTWGEWNISKVMRLCVHPVGSAWRGRWKSFGWPGGRLQQDVHGVFSLSGWFFWRFIACIFSGWDVHWLMYLKNLPKYTLLRVIYIYIYISGTYPGTLISFFENNLSFNLGLCVNVLCVLEMFWPKKMGVFLGPCEFKFVVFFSKKDPRKELQLFLLFGWETDVLKAKYFWGVHQFHLAYLWCLFGKVLRFFDLETNSHLH